MLNAEPRELENIYRNAVESAVLLRRSGEVAKAARVESLARIVARELARRGAQSGAGGSPAPHGARPDLKSDATGRSVVP